MPFAPLSSPSASASDDEYSTAKTTQKSAFFKPKSRFEPQDQATTPPSCTLASFWSPRNLTITAALTLGTAASAYYFRDQLPSFNIDYSSLSQQTGSALSSLKGYTGSLCTAAWEGTRNGMGAVRDTAGSYWSSAGGLSGIMGAGKSVISGVANGISGLVAPLHEIGHYGPGSYSRF